MHKEFDKCPHCTVAGKSGIMMRLEAKTPLISRSDGKNYHLFLFSGPDLWYAKSGAPVAGRLVANYYYASDRLNVNHDETTVQPCSADLDHDGVVMAMRDAADLIAEILSAGKRPGIALYYDHGTIRPLNPEDRP